MEEINAAGTTLRSRATEQKDQVESKAEVPIVTPQTKVTEQEKKIKSTNAKDVGLQTTEKTEQPRIRLPGHRRPIPEGIKVSDIREQAPRVAIQEWLVKLANEKERGMRLDKKCEELARLAKKQYPNFPSTAELRRLCKPILDRLDREREEAEQKREVKLKEVINLQNVFRIPEIKVPEIKLPEIKLPELKLPEVKLPETQSPENNLPKDPNSPSSPILSPVIYFRNTEPHSPSYMMSGALPFEYGDVDMEDARST
ncbi:hypothetical protein E8E13_002374 [Curvularia kusanoi]|uniref:Uncharacterized protein n=1 Tax=Curvularia kusanoi TaxID=90978 RepID=A0A9P4T5C5_CURKU|nr:hypothetical protein E8E13_002374 [Curvularia kusanoi]